MSDLPGVAIAVAGSAIFSQTAAIALGSGNADISQTRGIYQAQVTRKAMPPPRGGRRCSMAIV